MDILKNRRALTSLVLLAVALVLSIYLLHSVWTKSGVPTQSSQPPTPSHNRADISTGDGDGVLGAFRVKEILDGPAKGRPILLDIQGRDEFREGHIDSAINIPSDEVEVRALDELSKSDTIIIVERSCDGTNNEGLIRRAQLVNLGFNDVSILDQGIEAWKRSSFALSKGPAVSLASSPGAVKERPATPR